MDDITALLMGKNRQVAEMAKTVMKKLKEEVGTKGFELSVTENGKEGMRKMIAPCGFLEDELRSYSKEERVTTAGSVETIEGGLENERQEVGSERKSEVGEVQGEVLAYQEEQGLPKELHEGEGSRSCHERV